MLAIDCVMVPAMVRWSRALAVRRAAFWAISWCCRALCMTTSTAHCDTRPARLSRAAVSCAPLRSPRSCSMDSRKSVAAGKLEMQTGFAQWKAKRDSRFDCPMECSRRSSPSGTEHFAIRSVWWIRWSQSRGPPTTQKSPSLFWPFDSAPISQLMAHRSTSEDGYAGDWSASCRGKRKFQTQSVRSISNHWLNVIKKSN